MSAFSRVRGRHVTTLETRHPTDHRWWGQMELDPAGRTEVHVRVSSTNRDGTPVGVSLPFAKLDELQELIDRAREQCAAMGFIK